jgi:hypothetical protein
MGRIRWGTAARAAASGAVPVDHRAIAELAQRQHGAMSHQQVLARGPTRSAIATAIESGRWIRATRGVYLLAGHEPSVWQRAMAATLARPGTAASDLTAAHLEGWIDASPHRPMLIAPPNASLRSPIASVRRAPLAPDERTVRLQVPTTSPHRTLVDLAAILGPRRLTRVVDAAMHAGATSHDRTIEQLERTPRLGRAARDALLGALAPWSGAIRPGSPQEARLVRTIVAWGFPRPELQIEIVDASGQVIGRADGGWPAERVGFEYDSPRHHGPERWAADEARHEAIERLGWRLLHADGADLRPGERSFRDQLIRAWPTTRAP